MSSIERTYNATIKAVFMGDRYVGKTSLIRRYVFSEFQAKYKEALGLQITKRVYYPDSLRNLVPDYNVDSMMYYFWDIGGQNVDNPLLDFHISGAFCALLVFSLDNQESFENLKFWKERFHNMCPNKPIVIIANKTDLEQKVSKAAITKLEKEWKTTVYYTSCKSGNNVQDLFEKRLITLPFESDHDNSLGLKSE